MYAFKRLQQAVLNSLNRMTLCGGWLGTFYTRSLLARGIVSKAHLQERQCCRNFHYQGVHGKLKLHGVLLQLWQLLSLLLELRGVQVPFFSLPDLHHLRLVGFGSAPAAARKEERRKRQVMDCSTQ